MEFFFATQFTEDVEFFFAAQFTEDVEFFFAAQCEVFVAIEPQNLF